MGLGGLPRGWDIHLGDRSRPTLCPSSIMAVSTFSDVGGSPPTSPRPPSSAGRRGEGGQADGAGREEGGTEGGAGRGADGEEEAGAPPPPPLLRPIDSPAAPQCRGGPALRLLSPPPPAGAATGTYLVPPIGKG
eukprot:gene9260-biopygen2082